MYDGSSAIQPSSFRTKFFSGSPDVRLWYTTNGVGCHVGEGDAGKALGKGKKICTLKRLKSYINSA